MKIGELAEKSGLATSAIRYYESLGLIAPERSAGGTRHYHENDVERLSIIGELTSLGIPLDRLEKLAGSARASTTGDEAAHKTVFHLRHLSATLTRTIERAQTMLAEIEENESGLQDCFRCKEKPSPQTCAACTKGVDLMAVGRLAKLGR